MPGREVAGRIEAVGGDVTLAVGEEVFGIAEGSFAAYARARAGKLAPKPSNLTLAQAAAVPVSGLTALQAVRDRGHVQAGQQRHLSRAEMADRINASRAGVDERLACDEERVRRWESGEVRWPSPPYRRALKELTALEPAQLGSTTGRQTAQPPARIGAADAFRSEAELIDTLDLARMVTSSDLGQGTLDALQEAAELLCRAYPSTSAGELRARTKQRLNYISRCWARDG